MSHFSTLEKDLQYGAARVSERRGFNFFLFGYSTCEILIARVLIKLIMESNVWDMFDCSQNESSVDGRSHCVVLIHTIFFHRRTKGQNLLRNIVIFSLIANMRAEAPKKGGAQGSITISRMIELERCISWIQFSEPSLIGTNAKITLMSTSFFFRRFCGKLSFLDCLKKSSEQSWLKWFLFC